MDVTRNMTIQINGSKHMNETINNNLNLQIIEWISFVILLGIVSLNILVMALLLSRNRKSRMKFFVSNLAFADLCVGIFYVLPETLFNRFKVPWNSHVCYIYYVYFSMVPFYVSTYAIVVLSIDRAYVILKPLAAASKGKKYRYGLALSAWVVGSLLAIPYGVFGFYVEDDIECKHTFPNIVAILYSDLSSIIITPVTMITVCYIVIIITIRRRERYGFLQGKNKDTNNHDNDCDVRDKSISRAKIRTIKLLFVVVFAYIICWAPITVAAILTHHKIAEPGLWFQVLFVLAPLNSLANPLVFLIFNKEMFLSKTKKRKLKN
ncbi:cardioacceleratory peptide receptor-like [Mytilus californianus]|uniref:cardioacceleratory peptide receptor-like n=1 Tax=Mytilus californianus TaxID=6549 RepID=UPI002247887B|nr:cardioacceleratory peptide receptor-like [Mytilus californianus]